MTDYSYEACTKRHTLGDYPDTETTRRFVHKWVCLAWDRDKEFQLRQAPRK